MRNDKKALQDARQPLGIYVHVPFCRSKCEYCDFYSLGGGMNAEAVANRMQQLLQSIPVPLEQP